MTIAGKGLSLTLARFVLLSDSASFVISRREKTRRTTSASRGRREVRRAPQVLGIVRRAPVGGTLRAEQIARTVWR